VKAYNCVIPRKETDLDEKWVELCRLAAIEKDPQKLLALVKEINDLLEARDKHLRSNFPASPSSQS
jgi:hypothetical protein